MDKKQAQKKLEKKKIVGKVGSRKKTVLGTFVKEDVVLSEKLSKETEKPKRKDSRQVKIERYQAEVNLLVTERSSLHSIIGGLKSENNDLKDENNDLRNENKYLRKRVYKDVWVLVLGVLFAYSVLKIVLGFYGI